MAKAQVAAREGRQPVAPDPQQAVRDAGTMGPGFGPGSRRELMQPETFTGRPSVRGTHHMVSSVHYLAMMGGQRVLTRGGNAIDAGVAAGLRINVVQPQLAMFGGVAPIVVAPAGGEPVAISGLGRRPRAATLELYRKRFGETLPGGLLRTVTPAAPDAWLIALAEYGTQSLAEALAPALVGQLSSSWPLGQVRQRLRPGQDGAGAGTSATEHPFSASYDVPIILTSP